MRSVVVPSQILEVKGLIKRFGGVTATDNLTIAVETGELHAVIGPNGAGKTTLVNQLSGEMQPDAGNIYFCGQDVTALSVQDRVSLGIARSFQITSIFPEFSVLETASLAVQAHAGHSFRFWTPASAEKALREPALEVLKRVGLLHQAETRSALLSHGEKRALEIAMVLATKPRLLLLDEPMAGMGPEESASMIQLLSGLKRKHTIVLIEHDMDAVFALADRITVLVYGRAVATGTAVEIRRNQEVREAYLGDTQVAHA
jgi:branched-chain amino acid transport system ATP-binding protein